MYLSFRLVDVASFLLIVVDRCSIFKETIFKIVHCKSSLAGWLGRGEENRELDKQTLKAREVVLMDVGKKFCDNSNAKEPDNMIKRIRLFAFTKLLSKAKAIKMIRGLVDMYLDMETVGGVMTGQLNQSSLGI